MEKNAASYSCIEKIINSIHRMKECLICRICLELFNEPVTIKCGHKFCKKCILEVVKKEHATCPVCNTRIKKRSIPKEDNQLLQSTVQLFNNLTEAIYSDSGIDVLQPLNKIKHTKESISNHEQESIFKSESVSSISKKSLATNKNLSKLTINSKNNKKSNSKRLRVPCGIKTKNNKDTLHKYLSNDPNCVSNQAVHTEEKVKNWLENITQNENNLINNSSHEEINVNIENSSKDNIQTQIDTLLNKKCKSESSNIFPNSNKLKDLRFTKHINLEKEQKCKEIQRAQEVDIIAQNKTNPILPDKVILQTSTPIPVAYHSDANNWRRIKRVGKEMQANTFKSLNVSVEKCSASVVLDDTVPYNSTTNDSKSVSREVDTNNSSLNSIPVLEKKFLNVNNTLQCVNIGNINNEYSLKHHLINSSNSYNQENISLSFIDPKKVNEIIGISNFQDNFHTPEKTRNASIKTNSELITKLNQLSPLKIKVMKHQSNEFLNDNSSNAEHKTDIIDVNSPLNKKLSLRMKSTSSKLTSSESSFQNNIQIKNRTSISSKKQKNTFQLPTITNNEFSQTNRSIITFTKLGKMCRKRKNISFFWLGKLRPKKRIIICSPTKHQSSDIVLKSNEPINFNYNVLMTNLEVTDICNSTINAHVPVDVNILSTEENIQSKSVSNQLTNQSNKTYVDIHENNNNPNILEVKQSNILMEIDEIPLINTALIQPLDCKENDIQNDHFTKNKKNSVEMTDNYHTEFSVIDKQIVEIDFETKKQFETKISENNDNLSPVNKNNKIFEKYEISISSEETDSKNTQKSINSEIISPNKIKNINIESNLNNPNSNTHELKNQCELEKDKSISTSTSSSPLQIFKKKRTHSESSNDEDVSCIIDKWCVRKEEPTVKKQKTVSASKINLNLEDIENKVNNLEDLFSDDNENTLMNHTLKKSIINTKLCDLPDNENIGQVQSFKENTDGIKKLLDVPSSLLSVDLFESNEQYIQSNIESTLKQLNKIPSDNLPLNLWTTDQNSDKDRLDFSKSLSNSTIVNLKQFDRSESNVSEYSETSNKENACDNIDRNSAIKENFDNVDGICQIENSQNNRSIAIKNNTTDSQFNTYHVSDSLMNITQEQLAMKKIEKALIGVNLSEIHNNKNAENNKNNKFSTPRQKFKYQINNNTDDDFDSDSIDATPISKRRQIFNFQTPKSQKHKSHGSSPEKNLNLIPAVTPMKNRRSYPLSHSTPMVNSPTSANKLTNKTKSMILICSGLQLENIKIVQRFAKHFNASFQSNFDIEVTHVIVQTDIATKAGQKTFKYIQGITFKKHVVSFQWIVDCLKQNSILDENDEKYEVLDPEVFESGSKKSRGRTQDLFEGFAFFCQEPFSSFSLNEFQNLILYNGAIITSTLKELSLQKDKYKIVILETENLSSNKIATLKKSGGVLISYEWIVDSISQYQILPLSSYLYETTIEEALALGFPPEYFVEEETIEEEDEEEEEKEQDEEKKENEGENETE